MSANRAAESELGLLHSLVAQVLKDRIGNAELCTAADINAAIKFLKDNNITATPEGSSALAELRRTVEEQAGAIDSADEEELNRALENVVQFPGSVANA